MDDPPPEDRSRALYRAPTPPNYLRGLEPGAWAQLTLFTLVAGLVLFVVRVPHTQARWTEETSSRAAAAARVSLEELRGGIARFYLAHATWPGSGAASAAQPGRVLEATRPTENAVQALRRELGRDLPANPWNGLHSLRVLAPGAPWPVSPDGSTGWIYRPSTGEIRANVPAAITSGEVRFFDL